MKIWLQLIIVSITILGTIIFLSGIDSIVASGYVMAFLIPLIILFILCEYYVRLADIETFFNKLFNKRC